MSKEEVTKFPRKRISNSKYYERKRSSNKHIQKSDAAQNSRRENYDSTEDTAMEEEHSLLNISKRKKRKLPISIESDQSVSSVTSDSEDEQSKKELRQLKKKYLKKKYKLMKAEKFKWENSFIEKSKCINSLKTEVEKLRASNNEIINLLRPNNDCQPYISSESNVEEGSIREIDENEMIQLGPVEVYKRDLAVVEGKKKNSIFVKELALLFWTEEELMARSVTGRKAPHSKEDKEPKRPLTPEKLVAIKDAFKNRLSKFKYSEYTMDFELKLVNKYLAEKINDLVKCKARKRLSYLEKVYGNEKEGNVKEADGDS